MGMNGVQRAWAGALGLGAAALCTFPADALGVGELPALAKLKPGLWQVRETAAGGSALGDPICLGDPMPLLRVQHPSGSCSTEVVRSGPSSGTVQYTCPGSGFGHTTIRVVTPSVAMIETQGLSHNEPFARRLEARRIGACVRRVRPNR